VRAAAALTVVAALLAPLAIGGWNFSAQALAPKFKRLDPISGIGRMFSCRAVELGKSLARFAVVGGDRGALVLWMSPTSCWRSGDGAAPLAIGHAWPRRDGAHRARRFAGADRGGRRAASSCGSTVGSCG
jgi:hypothetical protein